MMETSIDSALVKVGVSIISIKIRIRLMFTLDSIEHINEKMPTGIEALNRGSVQVIVRNTSRFLIHELNEKHK